MTDLLTSIQDEPNLHFTNFTKFYTMEDKKGGSPPKSAISELNNDSKLQALTQAEAAKLRGGKKLTSSCGDTPPQ